VLSEPVFQIARLEARRFAADRFTWAGLAAFIVVLLIGAVEYWNSLPPRPQGARLFGEAYLLGLSLAFHTSIAQDRLTHFDCFLASNFVRTRDLYFGKLIAALLFLLSAAFTAFLLSMITSLGDMQYAGHYAVVFLTGSLLLLPAAALLEIGLTTRYPVPLVLAILFALIAVYHRIGDLPRALHLLGFDGQLSLSGTITRSLAALALAAGCYPLYRLRLGRVSSTRL
jgi:hypothetical protein